jgi:nicotinate phosphoribosyltransferase
MAFERFARARPDNLTFLLDTYDTEAAARKVVALAPKLAKAGIAIRAVRLDSGDLSALSRSVRRVLDAGGLQAVSIMASGGLDEDDLLALTAAKAPIDGFGIGTSLTTSSDVPALDCAYKLQEYDGLPRRKRSLGKATWPGRRQVWRRHDTHMLMIEDIVAVEGDEQEGAPLVVKVMAAGKRLGETPSLDNIRARAASEQQRLPDALRRLQSGARYPVTIAASLQKLASETDRRIAAALRVVP